MTARERRASVRARRKKRGRSLMIAYALRGVILLLLALTIVLMVCGVLYIRDHLAPAPDSKLPDGNVGPDDPALSSLIGRPPKSALNHHRPRVDGGTASRQLCALRGLGALHIARRLQFPVDELQGDLKRLDATGGEGVLGFARRQLHQGFFAFAQR